jgi:trigger factor
MLHHIKKLFGIKPKETPVAEVPYKVETPAVNADGTVADQATQAVVESMMPAKKPAAKKAPAKKPAAKKPRNPKAAK